MNIDCVCSQAPGKHGKARDTPPGLSLTPTTVIMLKYLCLFSILARLSPTSGSSIRGELHSGDDVLQNKMIKRLQRYFSEERAPVTDCDPPVRLTSLAPPQESCWLLVSSLLSGAQGLHSCQ